MNIAKIGIALLSLATTALTVGNATTETKVVEQHNIEYRHEINTTHRYYIDGIEVSEEDFNKIKEVPTIVSNEKEIITEVNTEPNLIEETDTESDSVKSKDKKIYAVYDNYEEYATKVSTVEQKLPGLLLHFNAFTSNKFGLFSVNISRHPNHSSNTFDDYINFSAYKESEYKEGLGNPNLATRASGQGYEIEGFGNITINGLVLLTDVTIKEVVDTITSYGGMRMRNVVLTYKKARLISVTDFIDEFMKLEEVTLPHSFKEEGDIFIRTSRNNQITDLLPAVEQTKYFNKELNMNETYRKNYFYIYANEVIMNNRWTVDIDSRFAGTIMEESQMHCAILKVNKIYEPTIRDTDFRSIQQSIDVVVEENFRCLLIDGKLFKYTFELN